MLGGVANVGSTPWKKYIFFFQFFFSEKNLANFFEFFFSCVLPINSWGKMKKGSVQFLVSLCEDITAWCQKWQISFQTSKLSSLLKEIFTYWQFLVMAVDFISASWALTCWLLSALGRCFYRVKKCPLFWNWKFSFFLQVLTIFFQVLNMSFFCQFFSSFTFSSSLNA